MWDKLPAEIKAELQDKRFTSRSHHSRSTYADGCHGPLCTKAERDRSRRRTEYRAMRSGKAYNPIPRSQEAIAFDVFLDAVKAWLDDPATVIPERTEVA